MKREDWMRMMESVDDVYIREAEPGCGSAAGKDEEKRSDRRKGKGRIVIGIAAACAAAFTLVWMAGSRPGALCPQEEVLLDAEKTGEALQGTQAEENAGDSRAETGQGEAAAAEPEEPIDFARYFREPSSPEIEADITLEAGGCRYAYRGWEGLPELPFETGAFTEAEAVVYCREDGTPQNVYLRLGNGDEKSVTIAISRDGQLFSCFPIREEEAVPYHGILVYGFVSGTDSEGQPYLELHFESAGMGYNVTAGGLSYEEMGMIMTGLADRGLLPDDFDPGAGIESRSEARWLEWEEIQRLEAFAGGIPDMKEVGGYVCAKENGDNNYFVEYESGEVVSETVDRIYQQPGGYGYLIVEFMTEPGEVDFSIGEMTPELVDRYRYASDEGKGYRWSHFVIQCDGYRISLSANCPDAVLWEYLGRLI